MGNAVRKHAVTERQMPSDGMAKQTETERPLDCIRDSGILGKGGFGEVTVTFDDVSGQPAARKTLLCNDPASREAFYTELNFYCEVNCGKGRPWMPQLYGFDDKTTTPWLTMELLGPDLCAMDSLVRQGKVVPAFLHYATGALDAVMALHAEGYLHRDIKPENFVTRQPQGAPPQVVLIDFGLIMPWQACTAPPPEVDHLDFAGTVDFASTRQLRQQHLGLADDLESLGYTLLGMLQGRGNVPWHLTRKPKKQLDKFVEENKQFVITGPDRRKRRKEGTGDQPVPAAEAAAPGPTAGEPAAAAGQAPSAVAAPAPADPFHGQAEADSGTRHGASMYSSERLRQAAQRRENIWNRLVKKGKVPQFLVDWVHHCKSVDARDEPDYEYLRDLLHQGTAGPAGGITRMAQAAEE